MEVNFPTFEVIDGLKVSLWNKAMYTSNLKVICIDDYLTIEASKDIHMNVDQNLLLYIGQLFDWDPPSPEKVAGPIVMKPPPFSSIHISNTTLRLNYKPKESGEFMEFVNFVPLRNAKIVFREFYMFNIKTMAELIQKMAVNLLANVHNIQGAIAGMKPVKPIAKILANAQNIVILPLNTKLDKNYIANIKKQLGEYATKTTIEVLELGGGMNVNLHNESTSIFANQPGGIKEGLLHARDEFSSGVNTVFAIVRNSEETDLLSLPIAIVKPFTGSFSRILLGICNQLDPERKKIMDAKYKTK
jgi:hypothetical protein